jgi:quercetin dioxygenase-like cupin family protein
MNNMVKIFLSVFIMIFAVNDIEAADTLNSAEIKIQNLIMKVPPESQHFSEILLQGEIAETEVKHIIIAGPLSYTETSSKTHDIIFLFIKGDGVLETDNEKFEIEPESIAFQASDDIIKLNVADGDTLHYLKISKTLSPKDLEAIKEFPEQNRNTIYFMKYTDCKAYTEKIKSPNTVSRTVLPKDYVPRVAMGTVETIGPDAVGAHEHPMLDQLFLGLAGNDVIVHADKNSVKFKEFSILHIPIGSSHWVTVDEGKSMYYQWMDFFITKEGEEWLKTHKDIDE